MKFIEIGDSGRPAVLIIEDGEALAAEEPLFPALAKHYHVIVSVGSTDKQKIEQEANEIECYLQPKGSRLHAICGMPKSWLLLRMLLKRDHLQSDLIIAQMTENTVSSLILPMLKESALEEQICKNTPKEKQL